jgi:putative transposase
MPLAAQEDGITSLAPVLAWFPDFARFINQASDPAMLCRLRQAETIGRPLGDTAFLTELETLPHSPLKPANNLVRRHSNIPLIVRW